MEKLIEETLTTLSKTLEVDIPLHPDDNQKVRPSFNAGAMLAKFYALMVFAGWPVNASLPSYTGVHADIEFWKKHFLEKAAQEKTPDAEATTAPAP